MVILGAGYDTRAYGRLEKDRTRVFEVDRAPIQAQKIVVLNRVGIVRDGSLMWPPTSPSSPGWPT